MNTHMVKSIRRKLNLFVKMASALTEGEKVHIVAYDQEEKEKNQ